MLHRLWESLDRGKRFVTRDVWHIGLPGEEVPHGIIIKQVRVAILLIRGVAEETLLLRASALTFATMLFIVPFLAFLFYFIQTFNLGDQVYNSVAQKVDQQFVRVVSLLKDEETPPPDTGPSEDARQEAPAPEQAAPQEPKAGSTVPKSKEESAREADASNKRLQQQIMETIFPIFADENGLVEEAVGENPVQLLVNLAEKGATNPQTIGIAGVLFVLSTVFGFMRNVESSFNSIWGVRRTRNPFRAVSDYMMITLLLPFVAAGVLGVTAALESEYVRGTLGPFAVMLRGGQWMVICLTLSLLYSFVPNTRVKFRNAFLGGLVAGSLWMLSSWAYVTFQFGLARYTLFFSTFALFPLLLMWIYVSWLILLFGALLSFAYQNETTFAMERFAGAASYAYREALAVRIMVELSRRFRQGQPGLSVAEAAQAWNVPTRLLNDTLALLINAKLVTECMTEPVTYQPARSPERTTVRNIVEMMREAGCDPSQLRQDRQYLPLYQGLAQADADSLSATIEDLSKRLDQEPSGEAQPA